YFATGTLRTNSEVSMQCSQNPSNPSSPWCKARYGKIRAIGAIREHFSGSASLRRFQLQT
ncbi:hypothetical protein, partial [Prevotellamassilia timonensis]|uniref:hypothetical protein n=1 Tax=Prevotellamassilia timonensis TaxID=1852370 RepID=UPI00307AF4E2